MDVREQLLVRLAENVELTEQALKKTCGERDAELQILLDAEAYSLLGGGKRIRPFLVNEFCRMYGGDARAAMPFACALEMIHTYSLIHDDLPCMDDDDLRHGKPSNHKVYGYANALLAGDALLTRAFATAAANPYVDDSTRVRAVELLASLAGEYGMIGGQIIDMRGEQEAMTFEQLLRLHALKCGALIECGALLGTLAAGYAPKTREGQAASIYGKNVGLAFQVIDDILDRYGDAQALGKNVGTDVTHNKTTFLTFFDREGALGYAQTLTQTAVDAIQGQPDSEILCELATYLLYRSH